MDLRIRHSILLPCLPALLSPRRPNMCIKSAG
jgi:hypothetical protein